MFDPLGKWRYVLPIIGVIVICCIMSLVLYPILNARPKNVPVAIVSLDEGAATPQGETNLGSQMAEKIINTAKAGDGEGVIAWSERKDRDAAERALEENECYAALIIPQDFTAAQVAAAAGGTAPTVQILINQGKNTMLATTVQTALTAMLDQMGIKTEVEVVHPVSAEGGALYSLMGIQMTVMPLFMMSMIGAVLLFLATRKTAKGGGRALSLSILYAGGLSFLVAWGTILAAAVFGGIDMPIGTALLFFWLGSLAVILLLFGAFHIALPLGITTLLLVFACGMSSAMLAPEMLPDFWANWVYPWVPQRYIADGMREILYMGGSAWNTGSLALSVTALIGLLLAAIGAYLPKKHSADKTA